MLQVLVGLLFPFLMMYQAQAGSADSCDCPTVQCENPCEETDGVTFYTEKCDAGRRVKSCAKPTCVTMAVPNKACMAFRQTNPTRAIASIATKEKVKIERYVAETKKPNVAKVKFLEGKVWVKDINGKKDKLELNQAVRESDSIVTTKGAKVELAFYNGNVVDVMPDSELRVQEYVQLRKKKTTVLELIKGKVRNKVRQKYKGSQNFYRVVTKGAVAGVRGTDFVVTYEEGPKATTKVETLTGKVELASKDFKQKQEIKAGESGSFIVASNSQVFGDSEIDDFVARGYMTPVYKMTAEQLRKLDVNTRADKVMERAIASVKASTICRAPKADLNQCAWTCLNNPKGAKTCRTDLPAVSCVRKRCNANGEWADEYRLPASYYGKCKAHSVNVAPCNY